MAEKLDPRDIPALVAPSIKSAVEEMDQLGDVPGNLLAELAHVGAFNLFTPRELGGFEAPLTTALEVYEEFGRIDASVGWVVWNGNWGFIGALLDVSGRGRIWNSANPVFSNAGQPGIAVPVEGGYQVSGDWKLVSGSRGADWIITVAIVTQDGAPRTTAEGTPETALFAIHRDQVIVHDTWKTSGLHGSGSNRVVIDNAFVPEELVGRTDRPRIDRSLYRGFMPALVFAGSAAVVLGVARGALEETVFMVNAKMKLAAHAHIQSAVARSEAALKGARLLLHDAAGELVAAAERAEQVTLAQRADLRAAMSHAARISREVLVDMYELGGSSSVVSGSRVERLFRDGMVALQHFSFSTAYFEAVGRVRFAMDPAMPLF